MDVDNSHEVIDNFNGADSDGELEFSNVVDPSLFSAHKPPMATSSTTERQQSQRARVEDAVEDDKPGYASSDCWVETFPTPAGTRKGRGRPSFEKHQNMQNVAGCDSWSPFTSKEEWELARWLMCSGVSQTKIDEFLKLDLVRISRNVVE